MLYFVADGDVLQFSNTDVTSVCTPVHVDRFEKLLKESKYDPAEIQLIIKGFREGFDIGYRGPTTGIRRTAPNLKLNVGSELELWNKVMKEVQLGRFAGPFLDIPFTNFIQSPIGLVPKDRGKQTRLIFHLSHPQSGSSVNSQTPKSMCTTEYKDFSDAVRMCINKGISCSAGKSDIKSDFRNLGVLPSQFCWLVMKVRSPVDRKWYYFLDKCIPFGSLVSCSHFQRVSDGIAHIVKFQNGGKPLVNYLDDFFFAALLKAACNLQIQNFLNICEEIGFTVLMDKTYWGETSITFLGLLIDTVWQMVSIPADKVECAKILISEIMVSKITTVHKLQKLCGFLNF